MALQGGGAMGAFQVGAYQALSEKGYEPDWVAGISIGAINASIIAGNEQKDRLQRLNDFWGTVAGYLDWWEYVPNYSEQLMNWWKVWLSMVGGVSGFFQPNWIPPLFAPINSLQAQSLYTVQKLKTTLQRLINFDFLWDYNSPTHVRLSLGVTRVLGGVPEIFQTYDSPEPADRHCHYTPTVISIDHILASGAMAPWFPGVVINKRLYWDGGMTSNTSFKHIIPQLKHLPEKKIEKRPVVIFVTDLWAAYGHEPRTFAEVCWRIKEIQYSSRIHHDMRFGKHFLDGERLESENRALRQRGAPVRTPLVDIVRVCYRSDSNEIPIGDALFSRTEIERRIADGYAAMLAVLEQQPLPWHLRASDDNEAKLHSC